MSLEEAALWAFGHLYHADKSNAAVHCASVRFSPVVFRLAETLTAAGRTSPGTEEVMRHRGAYEEDLGR